MRKAVVLVAALLLCPLILAAQNNGFVVRSFEMDPLELRAKTNPVYDNNGVPAAMVKISVAVADSVNFNGNIVGTPEHNPGEWIVFMPAGSSWIDISVDGYETLHYRFPQDKPLVSARGYELQLGVRRLNPMRTLVMPGFSYNKSQYAYGLMIGLCKRNGGYIHAKTDFNFWPEPAIVCDAGGQINGIQGWFTGASKKCRLAFTAGYIRQIIPQLYLYAGAGWGRRVLAWEMYTGGESGDSYGSVKVTAPYSFSGAESELGAILRLGAFALSAGVQTNQFKYYEANLGLGIMF